MKYYIVNSFDRPYERLVAAEHEGKLYYLQRQVEPSLKRHDGMSMSEATPIEDFGFKVTEEEEGVRFEQVRESSAKYHDMSVRPWQGVASFWHPPLDLRTYTERQREIVLHALGLSQAKTITLELIEGAYRNHYVVGGGNSGYKDCEDMVEAGFMERNERSWVPDPIYRVTDKGKRALL
jgi:hypothetical protein